MKLKLNVSALDLGKAVLTGLGQIMLCQSMVTGICFLAGMLLYSPQMAGAAVAGCAIATIVAASLKYDPDDIKKGLFGFNGALVGIAMLYFFAPGIGSIALLIAGAAVSAVVMKGMQQIKQFATPAYTAPFVLVTWGAWAIGTKMLVLVDAISLQGTMLRDSPAGLLHGIGQVMFQDESASGLLFLVGVLIALRTKGLWALGGSAVSGLLAFTVGAPLIAIEHGLYGYNGSLASLATRDDRPTLVAPVLAAALTVPILYALQALGLPPLTAPFVLATWITRMLLPRFIKTAE